MFCKVEEALDTMTVTACQDVNPKRKCKLEFSTGVKSYLEKPLGWVWHDLRKDSRVMCIGQEFVDDNGKLHPYSIVLAGKFLAVWK